MERGEIRWYEFQPLDKRRPVFILTRDSAIRFLNEVTVAPITTMVRNIPSEVFLSVEDGMPEDCTINFDHLQTVPKSKLGRLVIKLPEEKIKQAGLALCFALGFDELIP